MSWYYSASEAWGGGSVVARVARRARDRIRVLRSTRGQRDLSRLVSPGATLCAGGIILIQQILFPAPRSRCSFKCSRVVLARRTYRGARPPSASASEASAGCGRAGHSVRSRGDALGEDDSSCIRNETRAVSDLLEHCAGAHRVEDAPHAMGGASSCR